MMQEIEKLSLEDKEEISTWLMSLLIKYHEDNFFNNINKLGNGFVSGN